jgi:hypothetical protein
MRFETQVGLYVKWSLNLSDVNLNRDDVNYMPYNSFKTKFHENPSRMDGRIWQY